MKKLKMISVITILAVIMSIINIPISFAAENADYKINLSDLSTYTVAGEKTELKIYTQEDFETFLADYNSGNLPAVYVTEFLFDGVGMVKTPDLDDFAEDGNDAKIKTLEIKAININKAGTYEFSGEITGGMIAVNTNEKSGEINIVLNGAKIDTDSKKAPAIYVYNKDITYTGCKVTIKTTDNSKNYIEGGKFKKVSLVGSDELNNYTSKYSGEIQTGYTTYTNYYGIYTSEQINNILFAKVQADSEDLADGDPYYFYKGAGAISSDIDLYFEGTGYLEVKSKNKEGIETKGNLTFSGGTGDYTIYAEDDCLNTTTDKSENQSARNSLTIDVNSLYAIVDSGEDADEGDAIDSNGTLIINGGTIVAIAHPGQDAGLDSESGTYINGGTILATGDMYDAISEESKQNFMVLSFQSAQAEGTLITLLNKDEDVLMAYKTDRSYTKLVYSSPELVDGTYYVYKDGEIEGNETNGYYTSVGNYTKGTQQGYSGNNAGMGGMPGGNMNNGDMPQAGDGNQMGTPPARPDSSNTVNGNNEIGEPQARPDSSNTARGNNEMEEPPAKPDSSNTSNENETMNTQGMQTPPDGNMEKAQEGNSEASNNEFVISGISNQFSGAANYTSEAESNENKTSGINLKKVIIYAIPVGVAILALVILKIVKSRKSKQ